MNTAWLLEAASRSLLMGAITLLALQALRIDQIRARRTAWLIALGGALLMPLLVAAHIGPRILPEFTAPPSAQFSAESGLAAVAPSHPNTTRTSVSTAPVISAVNVAAPRLSLKQLMVRCAWGAYLSVAVLLLVRLGFGLAIALRLKWRAQRIELQSVPNADVRISWQLANPVTVTSSILLPRNYLQWDASTLRIVLSHEFAHVRQRDFYVQLLAGVHCALFWFNPFSWWLQRQLADLGEALSDHAAAQQADSRASYAELLLNFAAGGHPPLAAVAMARASNLGPRIERLLSERRFERSFASRPRLPLMAAGVVLVALLASTSVKRVDAAPADIVVPPAPEAPQTPEIAPWPDAPPAPETPTPPPAPKPAPKPTRPIPPWIASAPMRVASIAPTAPAPMAPPMPLTEPVPAVAPVPAVPFIVPDEMDAPRPPRLVAKAMMVTSPGAREPADHGISSWTEIDDAGVSYMNIDHDEVFVIKSGDSKVMFNGDYKKRFGKDMPNPQGDFIFYQHQGKPYLIQDAAIMNKAQQLLWPLKDNSVRLAEIGHARATVVRQRRAMRDAQEGPTLSAPEFQAAMREVSNRLEQLKGESLAINNDQAALDDLQNKLGRIQGQLGELQGRLAMQSSEVQMQEAKEQEEIAREHERLGGSNQKIINDAQRQLTPLIEQAIKDGRAKPVN